MHARSLVVLARLCAAVTLAPIAAGCSDDDGTEPTSPLVGTWNATSFTAMGQDAIALGMSLSIQLSSSGTYTLTIGNDLIDACAGVPSCVNTGT